MKTPIVTLAVATACVCATAATAAPTIGGGGGAEWYAGPARQSTGTVYGYAAVATGRTSLALGALGYDDRDQGTGAGGLAVIAAPLGPTSLLRGWGTRFSGDGGFHAYRIKAGPEWTLPREITLGTYFNYLENNVSGVARGGSAEVGFPLRAGWTGRVSGGATRAPGDITSTQGALGIAWAPISRLELSAEAGLARNGAYIGGTSSPAAGGSSGGLPPLPLGLGGGGGNPHAERTASRTIIGTDPTFNVGLRVALP